MSGSRYLLRRGLRWYFRLHVPEELQAFLGRDELRKSLKTSCYPVAKEAMRSELFRAERLFTQIRGGLVNAAEVKKLVKNYFDQNLEDAEEARLEGNGLLEESDNGTTNTKGLELHLTGMVEDLARGDYRSIRPVADAILQGAGIKLEKSSTEYKRILRETLKAAIAATQTELQRMHGRYDQEPATRSAATADGEQAKPKGVLLSEAVDIYMKDHAGDGHWTKKTENESRAIYDLLIGVAAGGVGSAGADTGDCVTTCLSPEPNQLACWIATTSPLNAVMMAAAPVIMPGKVFHQLFEFPSSLITFSLITVAGFYFVSSGLVAIATTAFA